MDPIRYCFPEASIIWKSFDEPPKNDVVQVHVEKIRELCAERFSQKQFTDAEISEQAQGVLSQLGDVGFVFNLQEDPSIQAWQRLTIFLRSISLTSGSMAS